MAETVKDPEANVAPEKETAKKETAKKEPKEKVYKFQSANKWLTCTGLGVQFVDGKAETVKLEVAKELVKLDGVTLIEE